MTIIIMITIEQVKEAFEKVYDNYDETPKDSNFIYSHNDYDYSDVLDYHRIMINKLWLSFWISENFIIEDESETLVYIKTNNNKVIHVLDEWLQEFKTLKWYVKWLNEMEKKANLILKK